MVDEFHHASAPTYHRLLQHFVPAFLLGLTATPDRTDNANILALCDDNLVYESDLFSGVSERLLVPFHYYGIFDSDVDYQAFRGATAASIPSFWPTNWPPSAAPGMH